MLEWEHQIVQWRRTLAELIGPDPNILDELESHLRDEVDRLVRQGHMPDRAVLAAIDKIGTPEKLAPEFAKVATPWWPVRAVLAGTALVIAAFLVLFALKATQPLRDAWLLTHVVSVTMGYQLTYGIGVLALCYALRRMAGDLPLGQRTSWTRAMAGLTSLAFAVTLLGVVLGGIWADIHWGRFWSWDPREVGALLTVVWQAILLASLWCYPRNIRWLTCLGLFGNVTVTFAWFVAAVIGSKQQLHAYGFHGPYILLLFVVIVLLHALVIAGAIAPPGWLRLRKTRSPAS